MKTVQENVHNFNTNIFAACKPEDPTRSRGCDTGGQELTLCQKYKMKNYCEDDNKWAYFVQPMCMFTCEKC